MLGRGSRLSASTAAANNELAAYGRKPADDDP